MELTQLKTFCAVAEERSFSKAALRVFRVQPTVSIQIKALEEELGVKLFERVGRRIILTNEGKSFYSACRKALGILDEAQEEIDTASSVVKGEIRVGSGVTIGENVMPTLLGSFKESYPNVKIVLFHRWANLKDIEVSQLKDEPFLLREEGSGTRMTIKRELEKRGYSEDFLNIVMELGSTGAIKEGVMRGLGVSIVNREAIKNELKTGLLKELSIKDLSLHKSYYLVYHCRRQNTCVFDHFLQFLKQAIELLRSTKIA